MAEVERALRRLSRAPEGVLRRGLSRIGLVAQREAKAYAPRSPTMKQISATLKRKRRTAQRAYPGNLEKSVEFEVGAAAGGGLVCSVFVAANGLSRSPSGYNYAPRIHDERYKSWRNLGPGSIAKNASGKVGEKFIERAIADNAPKFLRIIEDEARKIGE